MELAIGRRQELVSQSKVRRLTMDEVDELQAILWKELRYDYDLGKIGLLDYLAIHAIISYFGYCLKMEVMADGNGN